MAALEVVGARDWYETVRMADDVTLVHEPWIKPFFRCNMWHVRGRDRDLLFDSGLGHFSLRGRVPLVTGRPLVCVASHTHFDHIGCHHEFPDRCVHRAEAGILADPRAEWTLATAMRPTRCSIAFRRDGIARATAFRPHPQVELEHGDVVDLGGRAFEVVHTPGHSPGGIGLFERATGIFLSGDVIYDGPLIDDAYHSNRDDYLATMERLRPARERGPWRPFPELRPDPLPPDH